jgi:hypothetical protein
MLSVSLRCLRGRSPSLRPSTCRCRWHGVKPREPWNPLVPLKQHEPWSSLADRSKFAAVWAPFSFLIGLLFGQVLRQQSRRGMGADDFALSPQNGAVVATASVGWSNRRFKFAQTDAGSDQKSVASARSSSSACPKAPAPYPGAIKYAENLAHSVASSTSGNVPSERSNRRSPRIHHRLSTHTGSRRICSRGSRPCNPKPLFRQPEALRCSPCQRCRRSTS